MGRRDKNRFEKWFSFSRHKRRFGAQQLSDQILEDFQVQKKNIIEGDDVIYTYGSEHKIENHFDDLRKEFSGQSELVYTHAKLIVLIRRDFKTKEHYKLFESLWRSEKEFLLQNLNVRWLCSATDTFTDYSKDDTTRALALTCSLLVNTIKINETERFVQHANKLTNDPKTVDKLEFERVFDGNPTFKIGTDDAMRNLKWRLDKLSHKNIAGEILLEIFNRAQIHETMFKRLKESHTSKKTEWW
jgi:hypothetical protein